VKELQKFSPTETFVLTDVCMRLIRRPDVEQDLKNEAFVRLRQLANLKEDDFFPNLIKCLKSGEDLILETETHINIFWETHLLAQEYLSTIIHSTKQLYDNYKEGSRKILQEIEIAENPITMIEYYNEELEKQKKEFLVQAKVWTDQKKKMCTEAIRLTTTSKSIIVEMDLMTARNSK